MTFTNAFSLLLWLDVGNNISLSLFTADQLSDFVQNSGMKCSKLHWGSGSIGNFAF